MTYGRVTRAQANDTKECASCQPQGRDRAVYRCVACGNFKCEHLVGSKHADPERPGKYAGVCSRCRTK